MIPRYVSQDYFTVGGARFARGYALNKRWHYYTYSNWELLPFCWEEAA